MNTTVTSKARLIASVCDTVYHTVHGLPLSVELLDPSTEHMVNSHVSVVPELKGGKVTTIDEAITMTDHYDEFKIRFRGSDGELLLVIGFYFLPNDEFFALNIGTKYHTAKSKGGALGSLETQLLKFNIPKS